MERILKFIPVVLLVINVLVVDVFLYWWWNKGNINNSVQTNSCSPNCGELINEVPTVVKLSPTLADVLIPTEVVAKSLVQKKKSTQYLPIPGNGSTLENKWVDLSGTEFYISTEDYPNLIGAYFEANMKLVNGNGLAYLRLFDITVGIEVWGSEISTNSQNFGSVSSGKLTIRNGTHLYRVQAKSLTADTTIFNSGRIKIILEN